MLKSGKLTFSENPFQSTEGENGKKWKLKKAYRNGYLTFGPRFPVDCILAVSISRTSVAPVLTAASLIDLNWPLGSCPYYCSTSSQDSTEYLQQPGLQKCRLGGVCPGGFWLDARGSTSVMVITPCCKQPGVKYPVGCLGLPHALAELLDKVSWEIGGFKKKGPVVMSGLEDRAFVVSAFLVCWISHNVWRWGSRHLPFLSFYC